MNAEEIRKQMSEIFDGPFNLPEEVRSVMPDDKLYREFVGEKEYQEIKNAGDYTETQCQGVTILVDHSYRPLQKYIIIKVPKLKTRTAGATKFKWVENPNPTDPDEIISIVESRIESNKQLYVDFKTEEDDRIGCLISTNDDQDQVYSIENTKLESLLNAVSEWRAVFGWDPTKSHRRYDG